MKNFRFGAASEHKFQISFQYIQYIHTVTVSNTLSSLVVHLPHAISENAWFKMNAGQTGYYRVYYESENWEKLIHQLNTDHKVNKLQYDSVMFTLL